MSETQRACVRVCVRGDVSVRDGVREDPAEMLIFQVSFRLRAGVWDRFSTAPQCFSAPCTVYAENCEVLYNRFGRNLGGIFFLNVEETLSALREASWSLLFPNKSGVL